MNIQLVKHYITIRNKIKYLIIVLVVCTPFLVYAQSQPVGILPFELAKDNRIYIKCKINNGDSLTFLFDTGANAMVINSNILGSKINLVFDKEQDNMGSGGKHQVKVSTNNQLSFAGLVHNNISLLSIDYGTVEFDGVFGSNIMEKYIIEIDYDKKQLRFFEPKSYTYHTELYHKYAMSTVQNGGLYVITASLNLATKKCEGSFELDTGGDAGLSVTYPFVVKYNLDKNLKSVAKATSTGSDGISIQSPIVIIPEIQLGQKYFYNIPAILSIQNSGVFASAEIAGVFGNNFLKRFNIILDIPNKQIFLKSNNLTHTPYFDFLIK